LLAETLNRLASGEDTWLTVRYYEIRLLDFLGFRPRLFECVNCGREIEAEDQFFSFTAGGVICPRCGHGLPNLSAISVDTLKYLRHFQRSSYAEASRARPGSEVRKEAENIMQGYFTYLLERELNSPGFLKQIRAPLEGRGP
jgi:DNA repair protein RecO (recombination protein O)